MQQQIQISNGSDPRSSNGQERPRWARRALAAALIGAVLAGGLGAGFAAADTGRETASLQQALSRASLSASEAVAIAQGAAPGRVIEVAFKQGRHGERFEVTLLDGETETELRIDPVSGAIWQTEVERFDESARAREALLAQSPRLLDAISAAEARGEQVVKAELESDDGQIELEIRTVDAAGRITSIEQVVASLHAVVPAATGSAPVASGQ